MLTLPMTMVLTTSIQLTLINNDSSPKGLNINIPNKSDVLLEDNTSIHVDLDELGYNVYVRGDYAYVAIGFSGLAIIDISDPTNPGTPIYRDTTGSAQDVFVSGNYAYVADYDSGLAVIDISSGRAGILLFPSPLGTTRAFLKARGSSKQN